MRGAFKENKITSAISLIHLAYRQFHPILTNDYMENLVAFINHNHKEIEPLAKIALIHAQFELIHPLKMAMAELAELLCQFCLRNMA